METTPTPPTPKPIDAGNPFAALEAWLEAKVGAQLRDLEVKVGKGGVDAEAVKKLCEDILAEHRKISIEIPSMPTAKFEGTAHPQLAEILEYIAAGERFFFLVGPASTGKSTLMRQVAEALKRPYAPVALTETMPIEDLIGCRAHNLTLGTVSYRSTVVVETWGLHGVIGLDECDNGSANTLNGINAIEQGCLYIPRSHDEGGPIVHSPTAICLAAGNTFGAGADRIYCGRNQLDGAFRDRFREIFVDYDRKLEVVICGGDDLAEESVRAMRDLRKTASSAKVRQHMTTRMIRRAIMDVRLKKHPDFLTALKRGQCGSWTPTEISAVFN